MAVVAKHALNAAVMTVGALSVEKALFGRELHQPVTPTKHLIRYGIKNMPRISARGAKYIAAGAAVALLGYAVHRYRKSKVVEVSMAGEALEESLVTGSDFTTRPIPGCQCAIGFLKDGEMRVVGCAIRTEYGLWVPQHVVSVGYEDAYVVGKGGVHFPIGKYVEKAMENPFGLEMLNLELPNDWFSRLGLKIAVFAPIATHDTVTITGPDGKSSMGRLQLPERQFYVMGKLNYYGSTTAGFSGAPYMRGSVVLGIHLHGGHGGNGGQEALYLNHMYKIAVGTDKEARLASEDSGQKLMQRFMRRQDELLAHEVNDFVILRDETGHYHRTKQETYQAYLLAKKKYEETPDDWAAEMDYLDLKNSYEEESINPFLGKRPPPPPPPTIQKSQAGNSKAAAKPSPLEMYRALSEEERSKVLYKLSTKPAIIKQLKEWYAQQERAKNVSNPSGTSS